MRRTDRWIVLLGAWGLACAAGASGRADEAPAAPREATTPAAAPLAAPAAPAAATVLTVDELTARVLEANPDLKVAARALDAAMAAVTTAVALPNPRIEWDRGSQRPTVPGLSSGSMDRWVVAQPIENPRLRESRRAVAEVGVDLARDRQRSLRNDIAARVRVLGLEWLMRQEEAQAQSESLALLEQVRERIRRRVETGEAARYDLIKADAEIISARQRVQQSRLMAEQVQLALNRLAVGALPSRWTLAPFINVETAEARIASVSSSRLDRNPDVQVLQRGVQRAQEAVRLAQAGIVPSVDVLLSRGREPDQRQHALGLSVTVPLLDRREGPIAEARAEELRARDALDGRRAQLQQEWLMARKALEMALSKTRALSQGAIREAEAAVRIAEAAWRFGERGILDVLDAQRVLRALRADLIQARFEVQVAQIELDRLEGSFIEGAR